MNQYVISSLEQQWRKDPASRVFFRLAEEYRKSGAFDKAIEVCSEGIKHHPRYVPARLCLGRCRLALGLLIEAERDFREVLKTTPDNPHALKGLAEISYNAGNPEEALAHYETLAIHDPFDEEVATRIEAIQSLLHPADSSDTVLDEPDVPSGDTGVEDIEPLLEAAPDEAPQTVALYEETDLVRLDDEGDDAPEASASQAPFEELEAAEALDPIDLEFEKAIEEDPTDLATFEDLAPVSPAQPAAPGPMSADEEKLLTDGLKHEKMEHYEAALHIYRRLLETRPSDPTVLRHLERLQQLMASEGGSRKKIRLLSNWLDKIKGVYYVS